MYNHSVPGENMPLALPSLSRTSNFSLKHFDLLGLHGGNHNES